MYRPLSVLVVSHEATTPKLLAYDLLSYNCSPCVACTHDGARAALRLGQYDVIFYDAGMGADFARELISLSNGTPLVPVATMFEGRDYKELVEIPSTFLPEHMAIARTADRIALVIKEEGDKEKLLQLMESNFIRSKSLFVNPWEEAAEEVKERIWRSLGLIIVYSKKKQVDAKGVSQVTPMALAKGSTVRDFARRIHKDFIRNFRFARVWRRKRQTQAGLDYKLEDGDVVEIYTK